MNIKIITFCLFFVSIFFSCKKEQIGNTNNTGINGSSNIPLLSKVLVDKQSTYEYTYNDSNLISQEKSKFNLAIYTYNDKSQLVTTDYYANANVLSSDPTIYQAALNSTAWVTSTSGVNGGTMSYEYNSTGQLTKTTYSTPLSATSESSEFTYDANNRVSRQTMYWGTTVTGYIDYTYDGQGNLVQDMLYNMPSPGVTELFTTTQYEFDSKLNPYKGINKSMLPGINTNPNNIVKETYTIHVSSDLGSDNVQTTATTYTYNTAGYPVSKNGNTSYVY
jgi:YD repeat-containing protein